MDFVRRARFASRPEAVGEARSFVQSVLASWRCDQGDGVAVLLTSELVTNAVRHARTPCTVEVSLDDNELRVAVEDQCPTLPEREPVTTSSLTGRGLLLVDLLAGRWGAELINGGKVVWFALGLRRTSPPSPTAV
jgi:anti-sigma regulatory factor (Ser/Thr protein kinase)